MTTTDQQARAIAFLAKERPLGCANWNEPGLMAAITKVMDRDHRSVTVAFMKGAADPACETPMGVVTCPKYWGESAAVTTFVPNVLAPADRCGVCSKSRTRCESDPRHAGDDHVFDDGQRAELDVPRTVAAIRVAMAQGVEAS